ncbi:MAG TPA: hypothetical protein VGG73_18765 [Vicinamibacterales bacterium]
MILKDNARSMTPEKKNLGDSLPPWLSLAAFVVNSSIIEIPTFTTETLETQGQLILAENMPEDQRDHLSEVRTPRDAREENRG